MAFNKTASKVLGLLNDSFISIIMISQALDQIMGKHLLSTEFHKYLLNVSSAACYASLCSQGTQSGRLERK